MARNVLIVGLIITIIHVILLFVGVITYFGIFSPSAFIGLKSPLDNKTVISLADSSNAYSTLNVLVLDQNKFIDCTDDIVKLYKERGITIPLNVANASKICKVSIDKQVVNNDSNYVVIYTQVMPEGCTKPKQPNLLNITVNSQTNQTTASWVSGSDPSQWSSFKISEMSANAPDCATYVSILNQTLG